MEECNRHICTDSNYSEDVVLGCYVLCIKDTDYCDGHHLDG